MDDNYKNYNLDKDEEALILEQIKYLHGEFVSIQQVFVSVISIALAVYALIIYYALNSPKEKEEIFLFLPFLFSLSVYNILKYTIRVLGIDAYICHLEMLINTTHKKSLFLWQNYLACANRYSFIGTFPQLPCYIAMGIFLVYRFYLATKTITYPSAIIHTLIILLIIQAIFLAILGLNCVAQYWDVLEICKTMPPTLLSEQDIQKLKKIKPRQLYYIKLLSRLISKCIHHKKRKRKPRKAKNNNNHK